MSVLPPSQVVEPIVVRWDGREKSLGYLGARRWRIRSGGQSTDVDDGRAAAVRVLREVLAEESPPLDAPRRAIVRLDSSGAHATLTPYPGVATWWTYADARVGFRVDSRARLDDLVTDWLDRHAETAWAVGVTPRVPASLGPLFSLESFAACEDRQALARQLAAVLEEGVRESPHPLTTLLRAIHELKALGHDLWSWEADEMWGPDYVSGRRGAGLVITFDRNEDAEAGRVHVSLRG